MLAVVKRSGVTEPFSRSKVIAGVTRACQGRPVDPDAIAQLAQRVEELQRYRSEFFGRLREVLGERFIDVYSAIKELEHQEFMTVISPWEREHLLLHV